MEMIIELLRSNAEIDAQMYDGSTPLHEAVEKNRPNAVELLIESGANINICDENGIWPFFLAAYLGLTDCLKVFLKAFQESMRPSGLALSFKCATFLNCDLFVFFCTRDCINC